MSSSRAPSRSTGYTSTNSSNSSNQNRNRNRGPRDDSPEVRLSKALSWLLRHNATSQGIAIRPDGYVKITDVLGHSRFKEFTIEDIRAAVNNNSKKRFQILEKQGEDGTVLFIRAVQGHSIEEVAELGIEEITDASQIPIAVHGTMFSKWHLIHEHGLSKMNRNHIHLAIGLSGEEGVISGMRNNTNLYIYVDTAKALQDGIKFYKSSNNVILSDGKDGDGIILPQYFAKVQRSSGEVIFSSSGPVR